MKLHWSPRSPFVRKVMIVAHERGLVRAHHLRAHRGGDDQAACRTDEGQSVVENTDAGARRRHGALRLARHLRISRRARRHAETVSARAQGAHDGAAPAGARRRLSGHDGGAAQRTRACAAFRGPHGEHGGAKAAVLESLEREAEALTTTPFGIGHIAIGCALSYLDFRFAERELAQGSSAPRQLARRVRGAAVGARDRSRSTIRKLHPSVGSSTILPWPSCASTRRCASAACDSGSTRSICGMTLPCAAAARQCGRSAGV